jgi:hypothetical protein
MNNYQTLHPVKNKNHQKLITIKRKIEEKNLNKIHLKIKIHINWTTTGKDQARNSAPNVEQSRHILRATHHLVMSFSLFFYDL